METSLIHRRRISDEVADRLESMICSGKFLAGDQLPSERDLMKMFGVGRPAIREGLFSLQKIGLLTVGSGSKARVTVPTASKLVKSLSGAAKLLLAQPNGVRNLQDGRHLFEVALAKLAASKATAHDIRRLGTALEENRRCLNDLVKFGETDVAFHYVIAEIPQNPVFTVIFKAFAEWLTEQRRTALENPGAGERTIWHHQRIFDAIASKDPEAAEAAMHAHLTDVAKLYWKAHARADEELNRSARRDPSHTARHRRLSVPKKQKS